MWFLMRYLNPLNLQSKKTINTKTFLFTRDEINVDHVGSFLCILMTTTYYKKWNLNQDVRDIFFFLHKLLTVNFSP